MLCNKKTLMKFKLFNKFYIALIFFQKLYIFPKIIITLELQFKINI
jgi:hypothetical protein